MRVGLIILLAIIIGVFVGIITAYAVPKRITHVTGILRGNNDERRKNIE